MKLSAKTLPKRWILFGLTWLLIFAVAPLRHLALVQIQQTMWPLSALSGAGKERESFTQLLAQYPNDARVWSAAADEAAYSGTTASPFFPGTPDKEFRTEQRRRLDIAIEKFPDQSWLIAKRLKTSWGYMYGDRIGGELSDANVAANKAAGIPSPERHKNNGNARGAYVYSNYKPQELQRVLELCARGQKLEPNNAYYDWTRAYFLALAWRDKEAWQALDAAAQKPSFDDHQLADVSAGLEARELQLHRPLLWEEKLMMSYAILFPQYARYREFSRIVSWQSIKAQRRGDHVQALRLIGSLAKVSAKMRDNSKFVIERLVAVAIERIAIAGATYDARQGNPTPRGAPAAQVAATRLNGATAYANAHGRRDLAVWLSQDAAKAVTGGAPFVFTTFAGTSFQSAVFIVLLRMLGTLILITLPLCLLAWIAANCLSKIPKLKHLLQANAPMLFENETVSPRDIMRATLASGGLNLIGAAALGVLGIALTIGLLAVGVGQYDALQQAFSDSWNAFQGAPGAASGFWETLFYQIMAGNETLSDYAFQESYRDGARWALAFLPIGMSALWCARAAIARQRVWQKISAGENIASKRGAFATLRAMLDRYTAPPPKVARLEISETENGSRIGFDGGAFFMAALRAVATGVFWVLWLMVAFWPDREEALYFYGPLFIGAALGAALWFDCFKQWIARRETFNHRRRAARFSLRLMREAWLGWLALGSALFLLTLLAAMPLRARADAQVTRYLTLGEIATMK